MEMKRLADAYLVPIKALAVQFPLGHPAVAAVVVGSASPAHVNEDVDMFECPIPLQLWADLLAEELLPPGTPVPRSAPTL